MNKSLKECIAARRTYYSISDNSLLKDEEIERLVEFALKNVPSAFNSQSTRIVLLLNEHHKALWQITKDVLREIVSEKAFSATENKINGFAKGYGTILFFEDNDTIERLQKSFPSYASAFPNYSEHTSGMHQFALWMLLEDAGFGASLQHYNPIIDQKVKSKWDLPASWRLIAQMPFGIPTAEPSQKSCEPIENRMKVFK
ncbi:MAG: nitroreductase family protein [Bacteroidales bacterium]|jgi:predicted oxidoreductase (fatty acid repression mutant protein)|nr:nitroreductase family protein [Bacteroidales bacterium]